MGTIGNKGNPGPMKEETKRKIGAANKGKKRTPAQVANLISKLTGQKRTPDQVARITAALHGRKFSEEGKANMRKAALEAWAKRKAAKRND